MPIPQNITKQVGQGAKQTAQGLGKIVAQNIEKTGETLKRQVGAPVSEKKDYDFDDFDEEAPSVASQITQNSPQIDANAIHARERELLSQLESQLSAIRQREAQKKQAYNESVLQDMKRVEAPQQTETVEPQGKVRKAMGKVKQAVKTVLSRKQGETKQGSGKG